MPTVCGGGAGASRTEGLRGHLDGEARYGRSASGQDSRRPFRAPTHRCHRGELGLSPERSKFSGGWDGTFRQWPLWTITESLVEAGKKNEAIAIAALRRMLSPHIRTFGDRDGITGATGFRRQESGHRQVIREARAAL